MCSLLFVNYCIKLHLNPKSCDSLIALLYIRILTDNCSIERNKGAQRIERNKGAIIESILSAFTKKQSIRFSLTAAQCLSLCFSENKGSLHKLCYFRRKLETFLRKITIGQNTIVNRKRAVVMKHSIHG